MNCFVCAVNLILFLCSFFFFKQKTSYEMRISDWSSDVCSSDLGLVLTGQNGRVVAGSFNAVARSDSRAREVTVSLESPSATVGDLLRALHIDAPNLLVDGQRVVPAEHDLVEVELRPGAELAGPDGAARRPLPPPPPGRQTVGAGERVS